MSANHLPQHCHNRDPQDGREDEEKGHDDAPVGPLHLLGGALGSNPGRIATALGQELVEGGQQDGDHRTGRQVLPAEHPVEARPRSGHHLYIVRESAHPVDIADRQALEKCDNQQWEIARETVHQLEYITPSSICKAHGNQAAGEAEDLAKEEPL